jgi:hypothetical protein
MIVINVEEKNTGPQCVELYQQSFYYNPINIYNKLPDDLAKLISDKKHFLLQLKKPVSDDKPFYTMEEFF